MIYQNAFRNKETGEIFASTHVHDFQGCTFSDGTTFFVDGGTEYLRCGGNGTLHESLTLTSDDSIEEIQSKLIWGTRGPLGDQPLKLVLLCECETDHLNKILMLADLSELYRNTIQLILEERNESK